MDLLRNTYIASGGTATYKFNGYASFYRQDPSGNHVFYSAPTGTAGGAITFTSVASVNKGTTFVLEGGTSSAGTGIAFPATQSASTDANTLDDYEEGIWTPTLSSSGTAPTVSTYDGRFGRYIKIGGQVTAICYIRATISSIGSGNPSITGLPFSDGAGYLTGPSIGIYNLLNSRPTYAYISGASVLLEGSAYTTTALGYLTFSITYFV